LAVGDPAPYVLALSLASHWRIPAPFGQVPPLLDLPMTYLVGHSTFYSCCFCGVLFFTSHSRPCWLLSSVSCAVASVRRWRAVSQFERQQQPRPPQPWLTLLNPYLYIFFSEVPGKKPSAPIRLEQIRPSSLEAPIDLWWPPVPKPRDGYPVLFLIHGGAWRGGHRRCSPQAPALQALAAAGFLIISCEYRRKGAQWPAQLDDCKAALEWLDKEGATLGADLSDVSILGTSAGGHLAALLMARGASPIRFRAALLCYPALDPADHSHATVKSPFSCGLLRVQRGMSFMAWFFEVFVLGCDRQLWECAEPLQALKCASRELAEAWPPTLIIHGELDGIVPIEHSRQFLTQLAATAGATKQGGEEWRSQDRLFAVPLSRHSFEIATGDLAAASFDAAIGWLTRMPKSAVEHRHQHS
ncbi:lipM, partial [Symbiodinium sp. CCMP2456]